MYQVIPDGERVKKAQSKELSKKVNEVLSGTSARPFGLYDFIITVSVSTIYFFFTGLAILFGKNIPTKWLSIGFKLDGGNVIGRIKKRVLKEPRIKQNAIRVETIEKTPPVEIRV